MDQEYLKELDRITDEILEQVEFKLSGVLDRGDRICFTHVLSVSMRELRDLKFHLKPDANCAFDSDYLKELDRISDEILDQVVFRMSGVLDRGDGIGLTFLLCVSLRDLQALKRDHKIKIKI